MKIIPPILCFTLIIVLSCGSDNIKRILIEGELVEGNIKTEKDTIYQGKISFYDSTGTYLLREVWYVNDTTHGNAIEYYPNGNVQAKYTNFWGRKKGFEELFDSTGSLVARQYYYFDFLVGPIIYYEKGKVIEYRYYSFDNYWLFKLEYDSIKGRKVEDWDDNFFFENMNYAYDFPDTLIKRHFFIYVINPPIYNFKYSLCVTDSSNNVIRTLREIDPECGWDDFTINENEKKTTQFFVFKLDVFENNKKLATIFSKNKYL